MPPIVKRFVEADAAGKLLHVATVEYPEPTEVLEGKQKRSEWAAGVEQAHRAMRDQVRARGLTFVDVPRDVPNGMMHKLDPATGRFIKKTRDDFGPPPPAGEPDRRPDPATFPEPPS